MRLSELVVTESDEPVMFEDFVRENCGPYMAALDADMEVIASPRFSLYRGMKNMTGGFDMVRDDRIVTGYVKRVRTGREPKDTPKQISDIVDDALEEKFGWRPRSESAFCYTYKNRGNVDLYGERFRVYPMGDLEFVYSPKVMDLTLELSGFMRTKGLAWPGQGASVKPELLGRVEAVIREFIDDRGYTNKNLHAAMMAEGRPEIMVNCHEYLALRATGD